MTRLAATGSVYVTFAAAKRYAEQRGIDGIEEARREVTEYLLEATERTDGSWRYRKRSSGVDISARVVYEDGLAVVTTVNARDY